MHFQSYGEAEKDGQNKKNTQKALFQEATLQVSKNTVYRIGRY